MIYWQIQRIKQAKSIDGLIVATSTDASDDPLAAFLTAMGVKVFRGSLHDVFSRFMEIAIEIKPKTIVRLTGDCPLVMPVLLDEMIERFHRSNVDFLSNTLVPSFPDGLDIEIMKASTLAELAKYPLTKSEQEHVTIGIYERKEVFTCENFLNCKDLSNERWTVDHHEDLIFVRQIFDSFKGNEAIFTFKEVLKFLAKNPNIYSKMTPHRRNEQLDSSHDET